MEITARVGFDGIVFGMHRDMVKEILGPADSTEHVDFPEGEATESWIYNGQCVDLNFDSDCEYRLTRITFFSPSVSFEGHTVVGKSEQQLLADFPDLFLEDQGGEYGKSYEYLEKDVSFFVVEGTVESFTLVVPCTENGVDPLWPA